jgi:MFS family permease
VDTFEAIVTWVCSGGGAGVIGFWLVEHLKWKWLQSLADDQKRWAAFVFAGVAAVVVWALATWLANEPFPVLPREWVATIISVITTAISFSTGIHGAVVLRAKRLKLQKS